MKGNSTWKYNGADLIVGLQFYLNKFDFFFILRYFLLAISVQLAKAVSRFSLLKWLLCLAEWIWRYSMYILFLLVRDKAQKPILFCNKLYFQPFWSWVRISPKVSNFLSLAEKYHLPFSQQLPLPAEKYNSPFFFRSIWILSLSGIYQKILSPVLCKKGVSSTMNTLQYDQTLLFSAEWQDSIIFFCHFWLPCICLI